MWSTQSDHHTNDDAREVDVTLNVGNVTGSYELLIGVGISGLSTLPIGLLCSIYNVFCND